MSTKSPVSGSWLTPSTSMTCQVIPVVASMRIDIDIDMDIDMDMDIETDGN